MHQDKKKIHSELTTTFCLSCHVVVGMVYIHSASQCASFTFHLEAGFSRLVIALFTVAIDTAWACHNVNNKTYSVAALQEFSKGRLFHNS